MDSWGSIIGDAIKNNDYCRYHIKGNRSSR